MAWPDDIDTRDDYLAWTNTIQVGYIAKTAEKPGAVPTPVTNVLMRAIRKDKLKDDSLLATFDVTFRFAKAKLNGIIPKRNDIIIDPDGIRWVAQLVEVVNYGNEYRVHTSKSPKQNLPVDDGR